jgi:hypothetical protein
MFSWFKRGPPEGSIAAQKREAAKKVKDRALRERSDADLAKTLKFINIATEKGEFEVTLNPDNASTFVEAEKATFDTLRANGFKVTVKHDVHRHSYNVGADYVVISWR